MTESLLLQGRSVNERDLQSIRQQLGEHPDWSRRRLSRQLATQWDWRNGAGQLNIDDGQGRLLACLVFGAAAWKCAHRDRFIGWTSEQRRRNLGLIVNNSRFLILPWVKVPHLASWILGRVSRRIGADWQAKYGHPIVLLETFVERERFRGAAYQAANWQGVGATAGRTRQDRYSSIQAPVKDIYLLPLRRNFREALQQ
jgi:hypothetical protein